MKARPFNSKTSLPPYREHVVEVMIRKDQIEKRFSIFPALCACAIQPLPRITDVGETLPFRFHLEDWNNVVNDFLDERMIAFSDFRVLTEENDRSKGIHF